MRIKNVDYINQKRNERATAEHSPLEPAHDQVSLNQPNVATIPRTRLSPQARGGGRIGWIDLAKGFAISLVVLGHFRDENGTPWLPATAEVIKTIYLFHIPLFFLLSGITFHTGSGFRAFFWKKFKTLIVPYYVFSSFFALFPLLTFARSMSGGEIFHVALVRFLKNIRDLVFFGTGLWFLWALFIGQICAYFLVACFQKSWFIVLLGTTLVSVAFILLRVFPVVPFQIIRGLEACGLIMVGYSFKHILIEPNRFDWLYFMICILMFAISTAVRFDTHTAENVRILLASTIVCSISGSFGFVWLSKCVAKCKLFEFIGNNSLAYYSLNQVVLFPLPLMISRIGVAGTIPIVQVIFWFGASIIILMLLGCLSRFVDKYAKWTLGKF